MSVNKKVVRARSNNANARDDLQRERAGRRKRRFDSFADRSAEGLDGSVWRTARGKGAGPRCEGGCSRLRTGNVREGSLGKEEWARDIITRKEDREGAEAADVVDRGDPLRYRGGQLRTLRREVGAENDVIILLAMRYHMKRGEEAGESNREDHHGVENSPARVGSIWRRSAHERKVRILQSDSVIAIVFLLKCNKIRLDYSYLMIDRATPVALARVCRASFHEFCGDKTMRSILLLAPFLLLFTALPLEAQFSSLGTEFYVGFIQNRTLSSGRPSNGSPSDVATAFYISNSSTLTSARVRIEYMGITDRLGYEVDGVAMPLTDGGVEIDITPKDGKMIVVVPTVDGTPADPQIIGNGRVGRSSFHITSDRPIAVYAQSYQTMSRDVSLVLPTSSLGSTYVVMAEEPDPWRVSKHGGPSEFAIVAVEDATVVRFRLEAPAHARLENQATESVSAGDHTITLNRGETYQVQSDDDDLSGTVVTSDDCRPFALFAGNMAVMTPDEAVRAYDHIYEQMFPRRSWGKSYVTAPLKPAHSVRVKITAAEPGTTVMIDGMTVMTQNGPLRLDVGEILTIGSDARISTGTVLSPIALPAYRPLLIEGSGPIMVAQYGLSASMDPESDSADANMIVLSPLEQRIGEITFASLPAPQRYLSIVTGQQEKDAILLHFARGSALRVSTVAEWQPVGTSGYVTCRIDLAALGGNDVTYRLSSTGRGGFNAYITGYNRFEGYGYAAGVNLDPLQSERMEDRVHCAGEVITLEAPEGDGWLWEPAEEFADPTAREQTITVTTGSTDIGVAVRRGCFLYHDTVRVTGLKRPEVTLRADTTICRGESIRLAEKVEGALRLVWSPSRSLDCDDCVDPIATPEETTTYYLTAIAADTACNVYDSVTITVVPLPEVEAGEGDTICAGVQVTLGVEASGPDEGIIYRWSPEEGVESPGSRTTIALPTETTTYYLRGSSVEGCEAIDSVTIVVIDSTVYAFTIGDGVTGESDERIVIPVRLERVTPNRPLTDLEMTIRWDPEVMTVSPLSVFGLQPRTLLRGWKGELVAEGRGEVTVRFTLDGGDPRVAAALQRTGEVALLHGRLYIGRREFSELDLSVTTDPLPCGRVTASPGRATLDLVCPGVTRLIEYGRLRFVPPTVTPNPLSRSSTVDFAIPYATPVRLLVYAADGRRVTSLYDGSLDGGAYRIEMGDLDLATGAYTIVMEWGGGVENCRVVVQ